MQRGIKLRELYILPAGFCIGRSVGLYFAVFGIFKGKGAAFVILLILFSRENNAVISPWFRRKIGTAPASGNKNTTIINAKYLTGVFLLSSISPRPFLPAILTFHIRFL
jgi:hypothetical protein